MNAATVQLAGSVALATGGGRGVGRVAGTRPGRRRRGGMVLPEMVTRRRGRIVNLTSQAGVFR